jgi:hypothetical protein
MNFRGDVEELGEDEGSEGDGNDVDEGTLKKENGHKHDDGALTKIARENHGPTYYLLFA